MALLLFLIFFDWNLLRGYIGEKVAERTGREFSIDGNFAVDLWLFPRELRRYDAPEALNWFANVSGRSVARDILLLHLAGLLPRRLHLRT